MIGYRPPAEKRRRLEYAEALPMQALYRVLLMFGNAFCGEAWKSEAQRTPRT